MSLLKSRVLQIVLASCAVVASACTVTESVKGTIDNISDFTSSTTPGAWSTKDGLLRAEFRPIAFTTFNYDTVKGDIARGHGEHLTSLATLLGVSQERCKEFGLLAQARYAGLESPRTTPEEILVSMKSILNAHPDLVSGRNVN